jgi:peptidylprolyl isomerase
MKKLFIFIVLLGALTLSLSNAASAQKVDKKAAGTTVAIIKTTMGTVEIAFYEKEAPKTVENFIGLAKKGFYNGLLFHRVIDGFMIQGGDPTGTGSGGTSIWGKEFEDEVTPKLVFDKEGVVAMANRGPNTNTSQFFITLSSQMRLNGHYSIFAKVIKGMEVVKAIGKTKTKNDRPVKPVKIVSIKIEKR